MDEAALFHTYELSKLNVLSSTQMSRRASAVITKFEASYTNGKPIIVELKAKARVANKLISIVEIAKRDLAAKNIECFQYNALKSEMIEIERSPKKPPNSVVEDATKTKDGNSDSEDAFETMRPNEDGLKKRLLPVMRIYLSSVSVNELKAHYA